jgi:hypothetical protein
MPFKVILFAHRKEGITPTQFREHLEGTHMPLIKKFGGDLFPLSHLRRYVARPEEVDGAWPPAVLVGDPATVPYDVMTEMTFADEAAFRAFFARYQEEEVIKALSEDEKLFMDSSKMTAFVVGEVGETTRD